MGNLFCCEPECYSDEEYGYTNNNCYQNSCDRYKYPNQQSTYYTNSQKRVDYSYQYYPSYQSPTPSPVLQSPYVKPSAPPYET